MYKLSALIAALAVALAAACGGGTDSEALVEQPPAPAVTQAAAPAAAPAAEPPATTESAPPAVSEPAEAAEPAAPVVPPQEKALVKVALNEQFGQKILVDARGLTLYLFDWDTDAGGKSQCNDDPVYHCSQAWPPLLTLGEPRAGKGATSSLLGTQERDDGTIQVTYNDHPVYYFAGYDASPPDTSPGDVYGQGFINEWWVLSPKGEAIDDA